MKYLLLIFLLSCGSHKGSDTDPGTIIDAKEQEFIASFDATKIEPCDRLTFQALFDAYGKKTDDFYKFETAPGKWIRNYTLDCSVSSESGSECSFDSELSTLHALVGRGDKAGIGRMQSYLAGNGWKCGSGSASVTDSSTLKPLISAALGLTAGTLKTPVISDFRGYLVANYLWLEGQIRGSISSTDLATLELLASQRLHEPFFQALYHKYSNGDQSYTESLLTDWQFDPNFWPSCPEPVLFIISAEAMR